MGTPPKKMPEESAGCCLDGVLEEALPVGSSGSATPLIGSAYWPSGQAETHVEPVCPLVVPPAIHVHLRRRSAEEGRP